jgi:hypothetical protein
MASNKSKHACEHMNLEGKTTLAPNLIGELHLVAGRTARAVFAEEPVANG